jgi:hypothetical protein
MELTHYLMGHSSLSWPGMPGPSGRIDLEAVREDEVIGSRASGFGEELSTTWPWVVRGTWEHTRLHATSEEGEQNNHPRSSNRNIERPLRDVA